MREWSEHTKEKHKEISEYGLGEEEDAEVSVLSLEFMKNPNNTLKKEKLFEEAEKVVHRNRHQGGIYTIPTIENMPVKEPTSKSMNSHWSVVKMMAAINGHYIITNPKGGPTGIRLGTLAEFLEQQVIYSVYGAAFIDLLNARAEIINDKNVQGIQADYKKIVPALLPSNTDDDTDDTE